MRRFLLAALFLLSGGALALALMASRSEAKIRPNTMLGPVQVGGLTKAEAEAKLKNWWELERLKEVTLQFPQPSKASTPRHEKKFKLDQLGIEPDSSASTAQLQVSDLWDSAKAAVGSGAELQRADIRFKGSGSLDESVARFVEEGAVGSRVPARVFYRDGAFVRKEERVGETLDEDLLGQRVEKSIETGGETIELPLKEGDKKVKDAALAEIDEVVSSFTTRFPIRKKDRNTNIRIASSKIDGWVLMPGDRFSFNTVVGRRTIRDGFRTAPVFKNGKHDMGVGGGICQVSSTLYNAALFADLQISQRHNHSMPVAYLPIGRDATVDYGSLDLAFVNNLNRPVAISAQYEPGRLTFRILGKRDPALSVKIESSNAKSWDAGSRTVQNPKLPPGSKKVVDKGARGRSVLTYRRVFRDGVEVAKELLGRSYYKGGVRVVEVGPPAPSNSAPNPTLLQPSQIPVPGGPRPAAPPATSPH